MAIIAIIAQSSKHMPLCVLCNIAPLSVLWHSTGTLAIYDRKPDYPSKPIIVTSLEQILQNIHRTITWTSRGPACLACPGPWRYNFACIELEEQRLREEEEARIAEEEMLAEMAEQERLAYEQKKREEEERRLREEEEER